MKRKWSKDEKEIAAALMRLGATALHKDAETGLLTVSGNMLENVYFHGILPGEIVQLDEIISENFNDN